MVEFTEDLMTHVPEIDEQHKEFINCLNNLVSAVSYDSMNTQVQPAIHILEKYIVKHFNDEEALQEKYGYPNIKWHKNLHSWYITEFHKMKEEYLKNGATPEFEDLLLTSMINWIVKHISTADISLGQYIKNQQRIKRH